MMFPKPTRIRDKKLYYAYKKDYCEYCGATHWLERHHIIKRSQMGGDEHSNLIILCKNHHDMAHRGELSKAELRRAKDGTPEFDGGTL